MKAVSPIGAGIVGPLDAIDCFVLALGTEGLLVEDRMRKDEATEDFVWMDPPLVVQGDQERLGGLDPLQSVHVVGQEGAALILARNPVVPAGPGVGGGGHEPRVAVEHHIIGLVADGAQDFLLFRGGVGEEVQGLVAVRGDDDMIEVLTSGCALHFDAFGVSVNTLDRCARAKRALEIRSGVMGLPGVK